MPQAQGAGAAAEDVFFKALRRLARVAALALARSRRVPRYNGSAMWRHYRNTKQAPIGGGFGGRCPPPGYLAARRIRLLQRAAVSKYLIPNKKKRLGYPKYRFSLSLSYVLLRFIINFYWVMSRFVFV